MKFLITGGNGFIGSKLAIALKKNIKNSEITLLDFNFNKQILFEHDIKLLNLNLLNVDPMQLPEVDFVIHAAALLGVEFVNENPVEVILENIGSFIPLKKYLHNPKVKFMFFSTSEVYGDGYNKKENKFLENDQNQPLTLPNLILNRSSYALSKIIGEFITSRSKSYINLRPHNIYGPDMGNKHVIPNLINKFEKTSPNGSIEIFNPKHVRSFCHINDALEQILYLIETDGHGEHNIGNPNEPIAISILAEMLMKKMNLNIKLDFKDNVSNSPKYRNPKIKITRNNYITIDRGLDEMIEFYTNNIDTTNA